MTVAYGGCVEPEGWKLEDRRWITTCRCGAAAMAWRIERAEGSFNIYEGLTCTVCDYSEGDDPDGEP